MNYKLNTIVMFNRTAKRIIEVVDAAYSIAHEEATLTSGLDGTHSNGSFHYTCEALDFRRPRKKAATIRNVIWMALNNTNISYAKRYTLKRKKYDVVLEGDHIHVERDPS